MLGHRPISGHSQDVASVRFGRSWKGTRLRRLWISAEQNSSTCRPINDNFKASNTPVVVVGGGVGGLAVAGRLAKQGLKVTLLEKNKDVGGRMQSLHMKDWRFDIGPSLLLFPQKYLETFQELGIDLADIPLKQVLPAAYRVFFADGEQIDLLHDVKEMKKQLEAKEPGAGAGYDEFIAMATKNLEIGMPNFVDRDLTNLSDAKGLLDLLPKATSLNPWHLLGPYDVVLRQFFSSARIRAALTFQTLYVGLSPFSAPGVFSLLAGTEMHDGVYYPLGGFVKIRDALLNACISLGVSVRTECEVAKILIEESTMSVQGVALENGEVIDAKIVVCNRDLPASYTLLASNSKTDCDSAVEKYGAQKTAALEKCEYSNGIIAYCWAVDRKIEELLHHNVFLSDKYKKAWKFVRQPDDFVEFPNFYLHMPSRTDESSAPSNGESVMVLLPVANLKEMKSSDFDELIATGRKRVLRSLEAVGVLNLEESIVHEQVIDPKSWEEMYGLKYGAAFGLSHGLNQLSLFRPSNKDGTVKGLYFVGASTTPGNGVPLCLISGRQTSDRIIRDLHHRS